MWKHFRLIGVVLALVLAFAVSASVVWNHTARSRTGAVSLFMAEKPLPSLELAKLSRLAASAPGNGALPTGCRLLVFFSSTCPHCRVAAARDAAMPEGTPRVPVVWISDTDDPAAAEFAKNLEPQSVIRYGGRDAFRRMQVRGVPSAFLVSPSNIVTWAGAYAGGESNHQALRRMCDEP